MDHGRGGADEDDESSDSDEGRKLDELIAEFEGPVNLIHRAVVVHLFYAVRRRYV